MPKQIRPSLFKDRPDIASLFISDDPCEIYTDLRQIGCGNFGAVYYARNVLNQEIVAIKEIKVDGKKKKSEREDWEDIAREVRFLKELNHKNCLSFKGCYLKDQNAWDVYEHRDSGSNSCASRSSSLSDGICPGILSNSNTSAMISSSSETGFPIHPCVNAPSSSGKSSVSSVSNCGNDHISSPLSYVQNSHNIIQNTTDNGKSHHTRVDRTQNKSMGDVSDPKIGVINHFCNHSPDPLPQAHHLVLTDPSVLYPPPGAGTSNFATLKTSCMMRGPQAFSVAFQEHSESKKEADWREQMNGLKRLRSQHKKQLKQLEDKNSIEEESLKLTLNRDFDSARQNHNKELDKLDMGHQVELDKKRKEWANNEAQMLRKWEADTKCEIKSAKKSAKNESSNGGAYVQELIDRRQTMMELELRKLKRETLMRLQSEEKSQAEERIRVQEKQLERENALILGQHDKLQILEYKHKETLHRLKIDQIRKQHDLEMENQLQYAAQLEVQLKKRHLVEVKNLPKNLKLKEQEIRKQYREVANIQKKQFKVLREERLRVLRSSESGGVAISEKLLLDNLRDEERRKQADLESQYENSINELKRQQNDKIDSTQYHELTKCHNDLEKEKNMLSDFQRLQQEHMQQSHNEDYNALNDRIAKRKTLLEKTIQQKNDEFQNRRRQTLKTLFDRHATELNYFDNETHKKGIDNFKVISATSRQSSSMVTGMIGGSGVSGGRSGMGGGANVRGHPDWRHSKSDFMPS